MYSIIIISLISILWSIPPLVGLSEYTLDKGRVTCWLSEDYTKPTVIAGMLLAVIINFSFALAVLVYTNANSILKVGNGEMFPMH
jgi:hypothetical protein